MNDESDIPEEPRRDRIANPFGGSAVTVQAPGAIVQAEQQRAIAEVQARMIIARSNPRNPIKAMDQILQDCTRPTLAEKALYSYARGGTDITGPSIRLAEALAQRWGNIASGFKELSRTNGYSECVAYAWDLEVGFYDERQFQVRHWRDTRQGGRQVTDERDIYELVASAAQRRKRATLLTVIPGDVVEAAVAQCEETLHATADTSPEALLRIIDAFDQFGVTREQIEKRIQRRIDAIRPAQVVLLRKIYASLNDGMSVAADWFDAEGAQSGGGGIWGAVDQAHAQGQAAPQTTTRRASRKSAAKETASQAAEGTAAQEGGIVRQPPAQTQAAGSGPNPPAAASETQSESNEPSPTTGTSASAGSETRTESSDAGAAVGTSASAAQTQTDSADAAFSAWLIDGDGVAIDGTDEFTDPLAFAVAYAAAYADMFPPERKPFERANADSLAEARTLNPHAVEAALAGPKPTPPPPVQTAAPELPLDALHDGAVIPKPSKPTRASFVAFNDTLKRMVKTADLEQLAHIQSVNGDTVNGMPNAFRLEAVGIVEARRKELTAPAPAPARTNGATNLSLVENLIGDVHSLTSAESVSTWINMPRIAAHLKDIQATDRPGWVRVMSAANGAYVRMRVEACDSVAACNALETDQMVDGALGWLHENDGKEHDAVIAFAKEHRGGLAA